MKKLIIFAIFSAVLCSTYGSETGVDPEPKPPTPKSENITTTAAPTTSTVKPTTSTEKPTTTTNAPTTTKALTTTPAPAPNTTTAPATTTTSKPSPKPTPAPKPEVHTWVVDYPGTNNTCIVLKMILEIKLPYQKIDNTTVNTTILLPTTAQFDGSCVQNETLQNITFKWSPVENITDSVWFTFKMNTTSKKFSLHTISAMISPESVNFPNASSKEAISLIHKKDEFETPVTMSYRCKQKEYLSAEIRPNVTGSFIVSNLQVQAFRNTKSQDFDSARDCEAGETPGIVPIAVGCSLAVLIIVVLVAYLVGRRRSQARGYLSM